MKPRASRRALRRHHRQRIGKRRQRYWAGSAGDDPRRLGRCITTACVCSCWLCGQRRRHHGLTVSERRAQQPDRNAP